MSRSFDVQDTDRLSKLLQAGVGPISHAKGLTMVLSVKRIAEHGTGQQVSAVWTS